jgi:hypothetical protein
MQYSAKRAMVEVSNTQLQTILKTIAIKTAWC